MISLSQSQKEIMTEFYKNQPQKVIFNKSARNKLWKLATAKKELDINKIKQKCPALAHQIEKSYISNNNIQSAVFSECVYSQNIANMFNLNNFTNCLENSNYFSKEVLDLLRANKLFPRYAYSNYDNTKILIQAGGCNGIDSALILTNELKIYTIEYKEPGAKTCEHDLPKYDENGKLLDVGAFLENYPQFTQMLKEQRNINFFEKMGSNENNFSYESVNSAVSNNYIKKFADVVCTEDIFGNLVMMPVNDISRWAEIEGEIRPAGRNNYSVFTPQSLNKFITDIGGKINGMTVSIKKSALGLRKSRGGFGRVTGYKINSLFFVYTNNCNEYEDLVSFDINKVRQLKPTIAAKIFFKHLNYLEVKSYYFKILFNC